jgi:hypothetical protein
VFRINEDLRTAQEIIMHAIFCYGWWDDPANTEEGWWLCKNRCVSQSCTHALQLAATAQQISTYSTRKQCQSTLIGSLSPFWCLASMLTRHSNCHHG